MNLDIKTRHFQLEDEAREKIDAAFEKLDRFSPRPLQDAKLTIDFANQIFACDAVVYFSHHEFRANHQGAEPELAAMGAAEIIQRQLEKFKGRISARQRAEAGGLGKAMIADGAEGVDDAEGFLLRTLAPADAHDMLASSDTPFLVFRNSESSRIAVVYRHEDGKQGLMEARNE